MKTVARAGCNGTHAVTIELDGCSMLGIGDKQYPTVKRRHLNDLPHKAISIENGLPQVHAISFAFTDQDALRKRIRGFPDHFNPYHAFVNYRRGVEKFVETPVLGCEMCQFLQLVLLHEQLFLQARVFTLQLIAGFEQPADQTQPAPGQLRHVMQGGNCKSHIVTHLYHVVGATVGEHQYQRQQGQAQQPVALRRVLGK